MNKTNLGKLKKSQLIELILQSQKPVSAPRTYKPKIPIPTPRKSVKQIVQVYEDKKPIPAPKTKKPIPAPRTKKPIPTPRTQIQQTDTALKGHTKSYKIGIKNNKDPSIQMHDTRLAIKMKINSQLNEMKGLKYVETLKVTFEKQTGDVPVYKKAYFNSLAQKIINQIEIADSVQLSKQQILNKIAQWLSEGSGWTILSVDGHFLNIVDYKPLNGLSVAQPPKPIMTEKENNKPLNGSSYIQLPEPLKNKKGLINLKK